MNLAEDTSMADHVGVAVTREILDQDRLRQPYSLLKHPLRGALVFMIPYDKGRPNAERTDGQPSS
jgi:hypothetical protein